MKIVAAEKFSVYVNGKLKTISKGEVIADTKNVINERDNKTQ